MNHLDTAQPRIIQAIFAKAQTLQQPLNDVAAELGVTVGYLAQLRIGQRDPIYCTQDFVIGCANYLNIPPICVKILCGQLRLDDFKLPSTSHGAREDQELLSDPYLGHLVPLEDYLRATPPLKDFITLLYRELTDMHPDSVIKLPETMRHLYNGIRATATELQEP